MSILLTGATGFLGQELLVRSLEEDPRDIFVLVRAADDVAARQRVEDTLADALGAAAEDHRDRVHAVAADIAQPGLGLAPDRLRELASRTELIVHCAASVSFAMTLRCARDVNVRGTSHMVAFAEAAMRHGGLERYAHVSTAFVAGTHPGVFREQDVYLSQGFRNSYEQSKCEAELLLRATRHLPISVMRPSIVVGDRRTGWTAAFNVIYWPLRAFGKGLFSAVPAHGSSPVDVVSVDYVADAIHALARHPEALGRTFNLTAGAATTSIGEIAARASSYFEQPEPELIPPEAFDFTTVDPARQRVFEEAGAYFPYFSVETTFDDSGARALLDPLGIQPAPLDDYLDRLLDFATASRWGKRRISRAQAQAAELLPLAASSR